MGMVKLTVKWIVKKIDIGTEIPIFTAMKDMTVAEFIDALGGSTRVAALLKMPRHTAISNWKRWNVIPPKHRRNFVRLCEQRDLPLPEDLFQSIPASDRLSRSDAQTQID